jgi:hypothetical protein
MRVVVAQVSIKTDYGLDGPSSIPDSVRPFSSSQRLYLIWGPSILLSNGHRWIFPWGVKRPRCGADHSPLFNVEVKKSGAIPPLPLMSSWHCGYLMKHRENFNIFLLCIKVTIITWDLIQLYGHKVYLLTKTWTYAIILLVRTFLAFQDTVWIIWLIKPTVPFPCQSLTTIMAPCSNSDSRSSTE